MRMGIRAALVLRQAHRRPRFDVHGTSVLPLRMWPTDTDVLGHMNNGAYPSVMDLGRYDPISVYLEQRFSVDSEIFAVGIVRGRMLRRTGGAVALAEIGELLGIDVSRPRSPDWVTTWAENAALPSSRTPHITEW